MRLRPLLLIALLLVLSPALAAERILDFHSDITIDPDGSMVVRETLAVRAEGDNIRRGIYRDFPTRYRDRFGRETVVDFQVLAAARDGAPENWRTEALSNGVRVYLGRGDVFLSPGEYTYTLSYRTDRQLGFFDDHDELYWNVTGNGWDFPIDHASARVTLPGDAPAGELIAYTGPQGAQGGDWSARADGAGRAVFETTTSLRPREGLTIVVTWPKGYVREPTGMERVGWFLRDNRGALLGALGLAVVAGFYLVTWSRVGRDPLGGPVIPLYEPPAGISAAGARYLDRMGFDNRTFAAALISLAVKGYLSISEPSRLSYVLERNAGASEAGLSRGERALAKKLFDKGGRVALKKSNHQVVSAAIKALKTALEGEHQKIHFSNNRGYLVPGLALSAAALLGAGLPVAQEPAAFLFLTVWLTGWSFGVFMLVAQRVWVMVVAFGFFEVMALGMYVMITSWAVAVLLLGLVGLNILFHHLLKAPTRAGRRLMDRIAGFRMYLSVAEGDRLRTLEGPERTPELYERYLPYAMALGVEQAWSERFAEVLAGAAAAEHPYRPGWYRGTNWDGLHAGSFAAGLGAGVASAAASAATAPGSSSGSGGGGGGSSGGGGGGGGGGGW